MHQESDNGFYDHSIQWGYTTCLVNGITYRKVRVQPVYGNPMPMSKVGNCEKKKSDFPIQKWKLFIYKTKIDNPDLSMT